MEFKNIYDIIYFENDVFFFFFQLNPIEKICIFLHKYAVLLYLIKVNTKIKSKIF